MHNEVILAVGSLLDQHVLFVHLGQGYDQVFNRREILKRRFGHVAVAPLLETEVGKVALGHLGRGHRLDDFHAKRELGYLALVL